jgi:hypothetical protein
MEYQLDVNVWIEMSEIVELIRLDPSASTSVTFRRARYVDSVPNRTHDNEATLHRSLHLGRLHPVACVRSNQL